MTPFYASASDLAFVRGLTGLYEAIRKYIAQTNRRNVVILIGPGTVLEEDVMLWGFEVRLHPGIAPGYAMITDAVDAAMVKVPDPQ